MSDWRERAECRGEDPELFFPEDLRRADRERVTAVAKAICATCPVAAECLQDELGQGSGYGIRGGLTPEDRAALGPVEKACVECGGNFLPTRGNQIVCGKKCRGRRHERQKLESQRVSA